VNNKLNTLTQITPETAYNKPSNPVVNQTTRVQKTATSAYRTTWSVLQARIT